MKSLETYQDILILVRPLKAITANHLRVYQRIYDSALLKVEEGQTVEMSVSQ